MFPAVPQDDRKAQQGDEERIVDARQAEHRCLAVHDGGLNGRDDAAAQDAHHQAGTRKLHVVTDTRQGDAIDGGEHQAHAARHGHEAPQSHPAVDKDDPQQAHDGGQGKQCQQATRLHKLQEVSAHKPADSKQGQGT